MRVTRALMLFFAVAIAAGGCAQQPVVRYQMAAAPAPQGIDNVDLRLDRAPAYGTARSAAYGMAPAPSYGMAAAPAYGPPHLLADAAPAYRMAAAPAYNAAAPAYGMAAAPAYDGGPGGDDGPFGYPSAAMAAPPPVAYAPQIAAVLYA